MSYTPDKLLVLAANLKELAEDLLAKTAEKTHRYKSKTLKNVGISWYVEDQSHPGGWRWISTSLAAAKRWIDDHDNKADDKDSCMGEDGGLETTAGKSDAGRKLDPKAKVRSRGKVVFPAESPKVLDDRDHFELNDIGQARNALARSHQYSAVPSWYKGSLQELQSAVRRAVKKHYPSIEVSEPKKKSSAVEVSDALMSKYGK